MTRITNELFESIQKVLRGDAPIKENKDVVEGQVDKAHYCATHVEHPLYGEGECIAEAHADPDADGNIAWYTVQFSDGVRKVYSEAMKVKKAKMHEHAEVSNDVVAETEQTNEGAMSNLDADRKDRAYQTRQAKTTMKHISNPTPGERAAAKDIKPGIAGYRDRVAMLKSAQARGGLKAEGMDPVGKEDADIDNDGDKDKSDSYLLNRRKAIKKSMMKESVPFTIVIENQYNVDIPTNLTYSDYLDAVKTIISSDDSEFQQDIVNIAAEAFDTGRIEIIAEALLIKQGVLEAYRSTADYGNQKLYSKELSGTVDRSKPGVVKFSRDTQQTIGMDQKTRKAKKEREAKVFGNK